MPDWAPLILTEASEAEDVATSAAIRRLLAAARTSVGMDVALVTALHGGKQTIVHVEGDAESFGWEPGAVGAAKDGYCPN
jgi:hypothetical protein